MNFENLNNLLVHTIFYAIFSVITFFSIFAVYILVRYGKSFFIGIFISGVYIFTFLIILKSAVGLLNSL